MDQPSNVNKENNTSHFLRGTAWLTIANALVMAIGLVMVMVASRKFTADVYGSYILLFIMSGFLTQFTSLGLGITISKFLATSGDIETQELLVSNAFLLRLITFGITVVMVWIFGPRLFKFFGASWEFRYFYFVIILFFVGSFSQLMQSILQGLFCFKQLAIWNFSSSVLNLLFLFILIQLSLDGITILVFARWLAYMLAGIYMFLAIPVRKRLVFRWNLMKEMVKFGFPLQLNDILGFIYGRIDTLMIASMLPPANIAYFEVARKIPDSLVAFFDAFNLAYFPLFSRLYLKKEFEKAETLLRNSLRLISFIALSMAAVVFVFGKEIMQLLFSAQYVAGAPIFVILMITLCLTLIGYILGNSLVSVGESDKPAKINLVHVSISLLSNWFLIPRIGILGAGISQILGPTATNPLNYFFLNRKFPVHVLSAYLKPIIIFLSWIGLVFVIHSDSYLIKIAELVVFVIINILFSVITMSDAIFLRSEIEKALEVPLRRFSVFRNKL
jgi:O-antigen/teichoic acid export membrane protein